MSNDNLQLTFDQRARTVCTTARAIRVNPEWWATLTLEQQWFVLKNERVRAEYLKMYEGNGDLLSWVRVLDDLQGGV